LLSSSSSAAAPHHRCHHHHHHHHETIIRSASNLHQIPAIHKNTLHKRYEGFCTSQDWVLDYEAWKNEELKLNFNYENIQSE
jgi:phenylacetate-coenzyme A ligase PaaK-like adenylate-forming protein